MIKNKEIFEKLHSKKFINKELIKKRKSIFTLYASNSFQNIIGLIHKVYFSYLKTTRKHTAFTKTKSEVQGGGKKPWKQKGTGQARAGSIRSPLWVGGGVIFGPKPHIVLKKINKKENSLAIIYSLYFKSCMLLENKESIDISKIIFFKTCNIIFNAYNINIENKMIHTFKEPLKTKLIVKILNLIKMNENSRMLLITINPNKKLWLAVRNLKNIKITTIDSFNLDQILNAEHIIFLN